MIVNNKKKGGCKAILEQVFVLLTSFKRTQNIIHKYLVKNSQQMGEINE